MFKFLSHSRHATEYTSFSLDVFEISDELKTLSTKEILENFIKHSYFRNQSDWYEKKTEKLFLHTAFVIENLSVTDFRKVAGKDVNNIVISCLDEESWKQTDLSVRAGYIDTFNKSKLFTDELNIENDEVFYLNMDWFVDSEKIVDPYWIWDYALAFVLINPSKDRILMLDYGMD